MIKLLFGSGIYKKKILGKKTKNLINAWLIFFLISRVNIFFTVLKKKRQEIIGQWLEFFSYFECNLIIYYFSN